MMSTSPAFGKTHSSKRMLAASSGAEMARISTTASPPSTPPLAKTGRKLPGIIIKIAGEAQTSTSAIIFPPQKDAVANTASPATSSPTQPVTRGAPRRAANIGAISQPIEVPATKTARNDPAAATSPSAARKGSGA